MVAYLDYKNFVITNYSLHVVQAINGFCRIIHLGLRVFYDLKSDHGFINKTLAIEFDNITKYFLEASKKTLTYL